MPVQVSGIPRTVYELPLLKSLIEIGGAVKLGEKLYDTVAEIMGFAGMEMEKEDASCNTCCVGRCRTK